MDTTHSPIGLEQNSVHSIALQIPPGCFLFCAATLESAKSSSAVAGYLIDLQSRGLAFGSMLVFPYSPSGLITTPGWLAPMFAPASAGLVELKATHGHPRPPQDRPRHPCNYRFANVVLQLLLHKSKKPYRRKAQEVLTNEKPKRSPYRRKAQEVLRDEKPNKSLETKSPRSP